MTVIPISNLSQAEIHLLGVNIISAAHHDCGIAAVNRSLAVHDEQADNLAGHRPGELLAAAA